jgi:tRNA (guanine-N7-)-methyltransferase
MSTACPPIRRIRSFVTRAGRLSTTQRRALEALAPRFVIPYAEKNGSENAPARIVPFDWRAHFGREAPRILEIGFGMGETTAEIAQRWPHMDFLGIEVHRPGIGALLQRIDAYALNNIRIIAHDAVQVVEHMIGDASLDGVHIFFPDPWPKKRHHKRRLIQPPFAALLAARLTPGAYVHCATDWQDYAEHMLAVLSAQPLLENTASGYAPRPAYRPMTKFEARGIACGHDVWDLVFRKKVEQDSVEVIS